MVRVTLDGEETHGPVYDLVNKVGRLPVDDAIAEFRALPWWKRLWVVMTS